MWRCGRIFCPLSFFSKAEAGGPLSKSDQTSRGRKVLSITNKTNHIWHCSESGNCSVLGSGLSADCSSHRGTLSLARSGSQGSLLHWPLLPAPKHRVGLSVLHEEPILLPLSKLQFCETKFTLLWFRYTTCDCLQDAVQESSDAFKLSQNHLLEFLTKLSLARRSTSSNSGSRGCTQRRVA